MLWLFISYAGVLGVGRALMQTEYSVAGIILMLAFPVWRLGRRLRPHGGYRLIHNLSDGYPHGPKGKVTDKTSIYYRLCFAGEILVITAVFALFFIAPTAS